MIIIIKLHILVVGKNYKNMKDNPNTFIHTLVKNLMGDSWIKLQWKR